MSESVTPEANPEAALKPLDAAVTRTIWESRKSFEGFLRRHLPNPEIAEDLFQQSFLKALSTAGSLKDPGSVVPWFYQILRNALIDFYRTRGSEDRKNTAFLEQLLSEETFVSDPEAHASICGCMKDLIPSLKPEYADLIQKIDLDGQSPGDVAAGLGISSNNLAVRLHRARQALKTSLIRCCGACTEHGCLDCTCKTHPGEKSPERV